MRPATASPVTSLYSADPSFYRFHGRETILLGSRSDATGDLFWPPRLRCPVSGGTVTAVELASTGTVWSWTFVHARWLGIESPSQPEGYAAGLVDLDSNGPRVAAVLLGGPDAWKVGDRARARPLPFTIDDNGVVIALLSFEKLGA